MPSNTQNLKNIGLKATPPPGADIAQFRLTPAGTHGGSDIHADGCDWAGVCYLSPDGAEDGGTAFFRHRATGLERFPDATERQQLIAEGVVDAEGPEDIRAFYRYFGAEGRDRGRWEQTFAIPHRYNRAAFYDAKLFHAIDSLRGFEGGLGPRLTQVFFFNVVESSAEVPR